MRGYKGNFSTSLGLFWGFGRRIGQESSVEYARSGESSLTSTKKEACLSLLGNSGRGESSMNSVKNVVHKLVWQVLEVANPR